MNGCERIAIEVRFLSYIVRLPSGCMVWTGARSKGGKGKENREARGGPYGSFFINKEHGIKRAHVVFAWLSGKLSRPYVPDGQQLDHHCDGSTLCVCCTQLIPEAVNRAMSRSRPACPAKRAEAIAASDRARRNRKARQRRAKAKRVTRKVRAPQNNC